MKTPRLATLVALSFLPLACATEKPPDVPSWDLDVYPILRGSCSHCHGVTTQVSDRDAGAPVDAAPLPFTRYDICNAGAFSSMGFTVIPGAGVAVGAFLREAAGAARMPPPPAAPLTDYEATVLERWSKRVPLDCSKKVPNRRPQVRIIDQLARVGNQTTVTIEVTDPDGDQVMGRAKLGNRADAPNNPYIIQGAGRWTIAFPGANQNDRLAITVFDGYDVGQYP